MARVLIVGSGGRESALAWKLQRSPRVKHIWVGPGNGGTARLGATVENISASTIAEILAFTEKERPDLVVVGPEAPLADGLADALAKQGVRCFGPSAAAARIEASKAFAKEFMVRHRIPTAEHRTFTDAAAALAHINATWDRTPVVVKASGLAAGKGVVVPQTKEEARDAVKSMMVDKIFGDAAAQVVLEELMEGEEVSCMAFSDGVTVVPMPCAQDHKRVGDGDSGPNTGGMGAFAPSPVVSPALHNDIIRTVLQPAIDGMRSEGLMLTRSGPKTLEYNCRFGDPETEAVLPLLQSDLYDVLEKCVAGRLAEAQVQWSSGACAAVVCASKGYPGEIVTRVPIRGLDALPCECFHAGSKLLPSNEVVTNGGRVLVLSATASTLPEAVACAYAGVEKVQFEGMHYRRDVGRRIVRIGVLGSTRGTDMQYLIDAIKAGTLSAQIKLVISNKQDAHVPVTFRIAHDCRYILERARLHGLPARFIASQGKAREDFDGEVVRAFEEVGGVDLILLIGFMRIVSARMINAYPNRILNVHPSLLPEFAGGMDLKVHEAVLAAGRKESGCTVHIVDVGVDTGAIVAQKRCTIESGETPDTLRAKVQALEGVALAEAITMFNKNRKYREWYRA